MNRTKTSLDAMTQVRDQLRSGFFRKAVAIMTTAALVMQPSLALATVEDNAGNDTNFAAKCSVSEVRFDTEKLVNPEVDLGDPETTVFAKDANGSEGERVYVKDGTLDPKSENANLGTITTTYKEAAILPDDTRADVVVSYQVDYMRTGVDQKAKTGDEGGMEEREGEKLKGKALVLASLGKEFDDKGNSSQDMRAEVRDGGGNDYFGWAYALGGTTTVTINGKVTDTYTFLLPAWGVTQNASTYGSYKNMVKVWGDTYARESYTPDGIAYAPELHASLKVIDGETIRVMGTNITEGNVQSDQLRYSTGFAMDGSAVNGGTFSFNTSGSWRGKLDGGDHKSNPNNLRMRLGDLTHNIKSSTGLNGNIQTTKGTGLPTANEGGTLNDAGNLTNILGVGTYAIPNGKNVVYTMTPDNGYDIDTLLVDDVVIVPVRVENADGSFFYTYAFTNNQDHHNIHVTWLKLPVPPANDEVTVIPGLHDENAVKSPSNVTPAVEPKKDETPVKAASTETPKKEPVVAPKAAVYTAKAASRALPATSDHTVAVAPLFSLGLMALAGSMIVRRRTFE